jgi:hypothetical protein
MISGFHRVVNEISALLGVYTMYIGSSLLMFQDKLSVLLVLKLMGFPKTSVTNFQCMLCKFPEECVSHL